MKGQIHIYYDKESDYLEIRFGRPTISRYEKIGQDLFVRIDEKTGHEVGYAIFNVRKSASPTSTIDVEIPLSIINLLKKSTQKHFAKQI